MIKQNILISFRSIKRNKSTFFVNLIGLSTGLACFLLIFLWVYDELNIDKYHEKDSQLYQVLYNFQTPDGVLTIDQTPGLLAKVFSEEMAEVEFATAVVPTSGKFGGDGILSVDNKEINAGGLFADQNYFKVFSAIIIQGDKNKAFADKNSIVISEELAGKLFQTTENVIGKTVEWDHERFKRTLSISGVFENYPSNSTIRPDLVFNYDLYLEINPKIKKWLNITPFTYLILRKGTSVEGFNQKIAGFIATKNPESKATLSVQQYSQRYLYGKYDNGVQTGGRIEYVRLFSIIALFILIIACVNFMNLSTAKASGKFKEVGIKKAIGSNRKTLIIQFLEETLLVSFMALVISVILIVLLLPQFNALTGKQLNLSFSGITILYALIVTLLTGLLSGIYPALYISGFSPKSVLKGKLKSSLGELWIRKGLVIFQFSLSVILIIGFLVVNNQIEMIRTKNLGYNRDNVLCFKIKGELKNDISTYMSELKKIPGVVDASNMYGSIANGFGSTNMINWDGQTEEQKIFFPNQEISYNFIETLGIEMKEGRSFSSEFNNEGQKVIFNEAAIKLIGYKDPIGKFVKYGDENWQIIGVTKNFHFKTLYEDLEPCFLRFSPDGKNIIAKIKAGAEVATIGKLKEFYKKFHPKYPFEFSFLDADYQALYESETRMASLSSYFAGIAILISCLGLFVLSTYSTERRIKEIGIRKVNGARISEVLVMLNKDFVKWVAIAFVIATPIAYFAMNKWLENFAYKTELSWWIFALAGLLALGIALLTVSWQSWRAATRNPVEALRYE
jgi:putative ABC transport system permease protein